MSDALHLLSTARTMRNPTLFDALSVAQREHLRSGGVVRRFDDGQIIQQRGDDARGYWLVEEGQVRVGQFDVRGEFKGIALLSTGDSYGELAMLASRPRVADVIAVGKVLARWIPGDLLEAMIDEDPGLARRLIAALALHLQDSIDLAARVSRSQAAQRIAQVLLALAGSGAPPRRFAMTQQALADLAGSSRMTVNSTLGRLQAQRLIRRGYGSIEVIDRRGLRAVSRADEA